MRKFIIAVCVAAGMALSAPAVAQESGTSERAALTAAERAVAPSQKMDPEQVERDLAPMARAFGVKVDEPSDEAAPKDDKDMADVADRALDMVESVTVNVANTLKTMAPEVWRIMIRQQIAKAIAGPLGPLGWIIACLVLIKFGRKVWSLQDGATYGEKPNDAGWNNFWNGIVLKGVPLAVCTVATLFLVAEIRDSILLLVNPEYYAIKDLLQAIMDAKEGATGSR